LVNCLYNIKGAGAGACTTYGIVQETLNRIKNSNSRIFATRTLKKNRFYGSCGHSDVRGQVRAGCVAINGFGLIQPIKESKMDVHFGRSPLLVFPLSVTFGIWGRISSLEDMDNDKVNSKAGVV
jgi:hypothetical protein